MEGNTEKVLNYDFILLCPKSTTCKITTLGSMGKLATVYSVYMLNVHLFFLIQQ
jgi:hypothetical protein